MNKWLHARSELYRKYANGLPTVLPRIEVLFSTPHLGWLPVKFNIGGKESESIEFSDAYDPIPEMVQWLDTINKNRWTGGSYITIDCEFYKVVFSYEVMVLPEDEECKRTIHPSDCGLFTVYDTYHQQFIVEVFCETDEFVKALQTFLYGFINEVLNNNDWEEHWDTDLEIYQKSLKEEIQ